MFFFGDNSVAIDYYYQLGIESSGGRFSEIHYEEMSEKDLRVAITCIRLAVRRAVADDASEDILEALESTYEQVFTLLCQVSEQFRAHSLERFSGDPEGKYYLIALSAN